MRKLIVLLTIAILAFGASPVLAITLQNTFTGYRPSRGCNFDREMYVLGLPGDVSVRRQLRLLHGHKDIAS